MERLPIRSENLVALGYDAKQKVLTVTFKGGAAYQYNEVPEDVYRSLMKAESKGSYFSQHVRDSFACKQVP